MTDDEEIEYLNNTIASWPDWKRAYESMILTGQNEVEQ